MGITPGYGIGSLKPGVCTTATRPAAPFTGQTIYDTTVATTLVWSGSAWIASGGKVLQVVSSAFSTSTSTTSTSFVTTGVNATITPSSTSSKVLIMYSGMGFVTPADKGAYFTIFRGTVAGTSLAQSANGFSVMYSGNLDLMSQVSLQFLDSPSTAAAQTYTIGMKVDSGGTLQVMRSSNTAVITLMEISA